MLAINTLAACANHVVSAAVGSGAGGGTAGASASAGPGGEGSGGGSGAGTGAGPSGASGVGAGGAGAGTAASCTSDVIAALPHDAVYLAMDADHVYWTSGDFTGSVWRAPKTGGPATLLSTSPNTLGATSVGVAVDDTNVYWADADGGVYSAPKTGGPAVVILPTIADGASSGLAIDDLYIYAVQETNPALPSLVKVPKSGGPLTVLAQSPQAAHLAVDASNLYWVEAGAIVKSIAKTGGPVTSLSYASAGVDALFVDDSGVYGLDTTCDLLKFPPGGGPSEVLVTAGLFEVFCESQIATDATDIYWSSFTDMAPPLTSTVYRLAKAGGTRVPLLTCTGSGTVLLGAGVAVDATHLFWPTNATETLLALPK